MTCDIHRSSTGHEVTTNETLFDFFCCALRLRIKESFCHRSSLVLQAVSVFRQMVKDLSELGILQNLHIHRHKENSVNEARKERPFLLIGVAARPSSYKKWTHSFDRMSSIKANLMSIMETRKQLVLEILCLCLSSSFTLLAVVCCSCCTNISHWMARQIFANKNSWQVWLIGIDILHPVCQVSHTSPVFRSLCQTDGRKRKVRVNYCLSASDTPAQTSVFR